MWCRNYDAFNCAVNEKRSELCRKGSDRYGCCREIGLLVGRAGTRSANEDQNPDDAPVWKGTFGHRICCGDMYGHRYRGVFCSGSA